jgi:hypothetical protein
MLKVHLNLVYQNATSIEKDRLPSLNIEILSCEVNKQKGRNPN